MPIKRMAEAPVADLNAEIEAATLLLNQLRTIEKIGNEFDDETIADTIEGGTGLFEAIDRLLQVIHWDDAMIAGIKAQEEQLKARRERYEKRNAKRIWIIENALRLARRETHHHPLVSISFVKGRKNSRVEVAPEDEWKLPEQYWRRKDPEVNKSKIALALKNGDEVDGARLIDGEDGHRWKWK